jgi:hypothetical protein
LKTMVQDEIYVHVRFMPAGGGSSPGSRCITTRSKKRSTRGEGLCSRTSPPDVVSPSNQASSVLGVSCRFQHVSDMGDAVAHPFVEMIPNAVKEISQGSCLGQRARSDVSLHCGSFGVARIGRAALVGKGTLRGSAQTR